MNFLTEPSPAARGPARRPGLLPALAALALALLPSTSHAQFELTSSAFNDLTPASVPVVIPGSQGLSGDYYNTRDLSGPVILSRVDPTLNFSWPASPGPGINVDNFSIRWTGFINIPASGAYTFFPRSDDGVRLWINGVAVVNEWHDQGATELSSGPINLPAGPVPVRVEYYEAGAAADLDLRWEGPGMGKAIIPSTNLVAATSDAPTGPPVTFPSVPGQSQGPSVLPMGALSSATSARSNATAPSDRFPSQIYRDGSGQPTGAAITLEQSQLGYAFSSGVPRYMLGDFIDLPLAQADGITPASSTYWREQPVAAGEVINHVSGGPETPIGSGVKLSYYYSPHAKRVFASQPGNVSVKWVTRAPAADGRFKFRDESFTVSATTRIPVRPLYWTERAFSAPSLEVLAGRIQAVNPIYTPFFPAQVSSEYKAPGGNPGLDTLPEEKRTLWFDGSSQNKRLRAYNLEGRILVEYLGALRPDGVTYEFLGADVVEVNQVPPARVVTVKLGEEILPEDGDRALFASPERTATLTNLYGSTAAPNGRVTYYAERESLDPDKVQFYWLESRDAAIQQSVTPAGLDLRWPKFFNKYLQIWPEDAGDFAQLVLPRLGSTAGTGVFFGDGAVPQVIFQDDVGFSEAVVDPNSQALIIGRPADGRNRSLLKFINGSEFWYVRVDSRPEDQVNPGSADGTSFNASATVGQRIERPDAGFELAGYVASGTGFSPGAYKNPYSVGVEPAGSGAIIPVNAVPGNRELQVWWFRKVMPPNSNFTAFHVAARVGRYTVSYPSNPASIVMASNLGSGDLDPAELAGSLYVQNDRTQIGYNPNEEHALSIAGRVYALRDDLNLTVNNPATYTSEPFALLAYTNAADKRPSMKTFRIQRENDTYKFNYPVTAGTILQGPMPLPVVPLPLDANGVVKNREVTPAANDASPSRAAPVALYDKFTFEDRKGYNWVYRGPHTGTPDANDKLEFQFYYTMQEGFFVPGRPQPAIGTVMPYLRPLDGGNAPQGDAVTGTPITVIYRPEWPTAPELRVAETLTLPKFGLPGVRGQTSAEILYQQSVARQGPTKPAAILHDSTRNKVVALDDAAVKLTALPGSAATTGSFGKIYFQLLPPHLQKRFYYDPLLGQRGSLVLKGEFVNEIAGEDYTHLNVLSAADEAKLKAIVLATDTNKTKWDTAIEALTTRVETFIENPARRGTYVVDAPRNRDIGENDLADISDSDTAVDSYALTATGNGSGYVTLLFGDGKAFTPQGEPVSVKIIKVAPQLYTGDLKVLLSENPLDEQVTLRHSGDFAARPEDYEFEWRYAPPQDGVAPPVYTFALQTTLGAGGANTWSLTRNPGPGAAAPVTVSLPQNNIIHDAAWNAAENPPGLLLASTTGVNYSAGVPERIVLSAGLSLLDGFVMYVNGTPALANNVAGFEHTDSTGGLSASGLSRQWLVPPAYFTRGVNTIQIALHTGADRGAMSYFDFKLESSIETDRVAAPGTAWLTPSGTLTNIAVVGGEASSPLGSPLLAMSDNYFTMRYRPKASTNNVAGTGWSRWMPAKLVEGWIKRVLAGINPFNQRIKDLLNNPVNTDVSLLTQAGTRWEGDVALSLANINDFGLIEIYETVLQRGRNMSINSGYDYAPANDALLLAAGYLNDLYQILGNEAYADAANPTISIDDQNTITEVNTSRFAFEGQVSSVLEEELGLLRGRDDFLAPGVLTAPAYNRLYWNYTRGINSGEALYAVNYNIKEKAGSPTANGVLDAADAQRMFPQAHGDAYGHYLTALKGYYSLLENPNFTWIPRSEAVTVLGQAVQIDYSDERKFASAAANAARSAQQILALTHRRNYKDDPAAGWSHFRDGKENPRTGTVRYQGLDEWTSRATQGALFNWVVGNAILPDKDTNPNHTGVQIIDRTTVPELAELSTAADKFQTTVDNANARLNPLGLGPDSVSFDISPTQLRAGQSHFDQVYDRALRSVLNAKGSFDQASRMTRLLRNQENQIDDYNAAIVDEERAYVRQLMEIFGTPYTGDIGPGKTYAQEYAGPDFINWFVVDRPSNMLETVKPVTITVPVYINTNVFTGNSIDDIHNSIKDPRQVVPRSITVIPNQFLQYSDLFRAGGMGQRNVTGRLQEALLEAHRTQVELLRAGTAMDSLNLRWRREFQLFKEMVDAHVKTMSLTADTFTKVEAIQRTIANLETASLFLREGGELADDMADAAMESGIKFFGLAVDGASPAAGAIKLTGSFVAFGLNMASAGMESRAILQEPRIEQYLNDLDLAVTELEFGIEQRQAIYEHELLLEEMLGMDETLVQAALDYQRANEEVRNVLAEGEQVLAEREVFRKRAAAIVQGYRTRDLTFRTFRNEALEQYRTLFDLAGRYTYLATKSYDYETGLLGSTAGRDLMSGIVTSRSLGDLTGGIPQSTTSTLGDSGLAGVMARLQSDWSVAKGRLGINNPDSNGTLFSLRHEKFRILNNPAMTRDDDTWKQTLEQHIVRDLMTDGDVGRYCLNIRKPDGSPVPGIIIPFSTSIQQGRNFFGLPLAGGDHAFTTSSFATKIHSAGMVFPGYVGMDVYANGEFAGGSPAVNSPLALSATPYAYLIPCGTDFMRAPALGDTGLTRSWQVNDQALPLPFNLGATSFSSTQFFNARDTLTEQPWIVRKHQAFRPVSNPQLFYGLVPDDFTCRRLVGRSAWNSEWKIVIPAYSLLADEQEGLNRFVASVQDIQLFLRTYSHSGN